MAIPSATNQTINCCHYKWLFHLDQLAKTSAYTTVVNTSTTMAKNISQTNVAITSAKSTLWVYTINVALTSATVANNISHIQPKAITSAKKNGCNYKWQHLSQKINKSWHKSITNDKYVKIWQYKHPKLFIITFHIHHQKWVLWQGKHFPIHRMKPCQMDWRKLVVLEKCILLKRILVISLENVFY